MTAIDPWLLLFGAAVATLVILVSPAARMVAGFLVVIGLLVAGYHTFIRSTFIHSASCQQIGGPCRTEMSPTWSSWCWSSANAAVLKEAGRYHLVSTGQHDASGYCFDARFWTRVDDN